MVRVQAPPESRGPLSFLFCCKSASTADVSPEGGTGDAITDLATSEGILGQGSLAREATPLRFGAVVFDTPSEAPPSTQSDSVAPSTPRLVAWGDGASFTGEIKEGCIHGDGTYTWPHGESYSGQWDNHVQHGQGVLTWPDGQVYTGQFEAGKRHGTGFLSWPDGRRYAGTWRLGQRRGPWEFRAASPDAKPSEGDWGEGDPTIGLPPVDGAEGSRTWSDGSSYNGQVLDGEPHGFGTALWPNGSSFTGQYRCGKRSGAGVQSWPNGSSQRFVGQWRDGTRNGSWELTTAEGEMRRGATDLVATPRGTADTPRRGGATDLVSATTSLFSSEFMM